MNKSWILLTAILASCIADGAYAVIGSSIIIHAPIMDTTPNIPPKMGWFNGDYVQCRNPAEKRAFDKLDGHPKGDPLTIVDHDCSLKCGGIDDPFNMRRQMKKDAHAKDRWENTEEGCKKTCNALNSTYPIRKVFNCNGSKEN